MDKIIKKSFQILFKNSAVMQPVIIFALIIFLFLTFIGSKILYNPIIEGFSFILGFLLFAAFVSGWAYMIKYAVEKYIDVDKNENYYHVYMANYNVETLKQFFTGVGEYFLSVLGVIILNIIFIYGIIYLGEKFFDVSFLQMINTQNEIELLKNPENIKSSQLLFLLYFNSISFIFHFLILFWIPALFYKSKNPFISLLISIKHLFKNFWISLGLYLFLLAIIIVLNILSALSLVLPIIVFVMLILFLYFAAYYNLLVFTAFSKFLLKEKVEKINTKDVFIKSCETEDKNDGK